MGFDSVIFDLDGTLWDSCRRVAESWHITLTERFGQTETPSAADVLSIMGMTGVQIADRFFRGIGPDPLEVFQTCARDASAYLQTHGGDLYPGVKEMLRSLCAAQLPLFIVSNCQGGYIESFLSVTGLASYFKDFECEGRTGRSKTENIRLIVERNGLRAPVYVGDTAMDERSAAAAGLPFIHAAYGFGAAEHPIAVITAPQDLPNVLAAL